MSKINFFVILWLFFVVQTYCLLTTQIVVAQESLSDETNLSAGQVSANAGFVKGLWYSKLPFFAEDKIRIYAVIQNQSGFDIMGTIQFFDNDKLLNESNFSAVNGRLIEKWADWKASQGKHNISVKISNVKKAEIGKQAKTINLIGETFVFEEFQIDIDTDKDGIGNEDDLDDDGDGVSDAREMEAGTNPLIFNKKSVLPTGKAEEINEKLQNEEKNKTSGDKIAKVGNIIEKTAEIASIVLEKINEATKNSVSFLESQKEKVDRELIQEKKEEALKKTPQIDEGRNPYLAAIVGNIPALKEIYGFLLSVLIYILNSWWLLLGTTGFLLWLFWKMFKRRFVSERF